MAKEQKQESASTTASEGSEVSGPPKSLRLYIAIGFASLILFQMLILTVVLLSVTPPAPIICGIGPGQMPGPDIDSANLVPPEIGKKEKLLEKPIGDKGTFRFRKPAEEDRTASVSLIMTVKVREKEQYKYQYEYDKKTITIIDEITKILWGATSEEYREVNHTAIRERVKLAINNVLPSPWVHEVLLTEVNFEEQ